MDILTDISTASSTPSQLITHVIAGFVILAISIITSWSMRRFGSSSLFVKLIVVMLFMGFAVGVGIYDFWMILIFAFMSIALAMASKQTGWTA